MKGSEEKVEEVDAKGKRREEMKMQAKKCVEEVTRLHRVTCKQIQLEYQAINLVVIVREKR